MLGKTIFILLLAFAPSAPAINDYQARQTNDDLLPRDLSESEMQTILKEEKPKSRVETALKVSDTRINNAYDLAQEAKFKAAAQDLDVYAALIRYADDYTRRLSSSQTKDRNHCLKRLEQIIFKQTRILDAVVREMPYDYRESTERAVNDVKKIRIRAINDLLGGGSIINSSN
jgi:hypothetical protein